MKQMAKVFIFAFLVVTSSVSAFAETSGGTCSLYIQGYFPVSRAPYSAPECMDWLVERFTFAPQYTSMYAIYNNQVVGVGGRKRPFMPPSFQYYGN